MNKKNVRNSHFNGKLLYFFSILCFLIISGTQYSLANENFSRAIPPTALQDNRILTGTIVSNNGEPLAGVSITIENTTTGVLSDIDGTYAITVPSSSTQLIITYVGFITQKIAAGSAPRLDIVLIEDVKILDEVVVVAFGVQKRANLTAAVATIDSKQIANRPVQNVTQALQGISPGLNVSQHNKGGSLNENPKINIRGVGTIGEGSNSSPLILIDGMPGDMNLINSQDIENITVLKDAGAAAIYGSRAAFGVILITTKQGAKGGTVVNYNNSLQWSTPTRLASFIDGYSFMQYMNEASANDGRGQLYTDDVMKKTQQFMRGELEQGTEYNANGIWKANFDSWANTEWFGVYYKDWTFSHEHNLSISGGDDKLSYYVSGNFQQLGSDQNYGNEDYKRYTINTTVNAKPYRWLDINANIKFSRKNYIAPYYQTNSVYYHSMPRRRPSNPLRYPDGGFAKESQINELEHGGDYRDDIDLLYQQIQLVLKPIKNVEIFAEGNMRIDRSEVHKEVKLLLERKEDGDYFAMARDDGFGGRTQVSEATYRTHYYNPNVYAKYNNSIENHNFTVMGGFQAELNQYKSVWAERDGLISPDIPSLGNTISDRTYGMGSEINEWATAGFFGRINYNYKEKYLAEINYRYDGSSRFIKEKRWNSFPSFSAAWNIARESFMMDNQKLISNLKIRGSYGSLGNQATKDLYPFYSAMDLRTLTTGNLQRPSWLINGTRPIGAHPANPISPYLTWERVTSYNLGLDFAMLNNRLTFSSDYFWRTTNDMLAPGEELPNTAGVFAPFTNNAKMRTTGWELSIGWRDQLTSGFSYGGTFVLSDATTEILKYPNATKNLTPQYIGHIPYYPGQKLGEIWGYEVIDLARTDQQMADHLASLPNGGQDALGSQWAAGDVMYRDLNNDGEITIGKNLADDSGDRRIIGNNTPRYNFGLSLSAAYKGIDFSAFFQGTMKRDVWLSGLYFWGADGGYWQSTALKQTMDYFRAEDSGSYFGPNVNGYLPRPLLDRDQKNKQPNTRYLQDASYMRLKNIQVGYTIPHNLLQSARINNLRVFLSADNVFTITGIKSKSYDPEVLDGYSVGHGKAAPLRSTISCGLSITL